MCVNLFSASTEGVVELFVQIVLYNNLAAVLADFNNLLIFRKLQVQHIDNAKKLC